MTETTITETTEGSSTGGGGQQNQVARVESLFLTHVQGDHSGCDKSPVVDFITKVVFKYEARVVKCNLCFEVNGSQCLHSINFSKL